MQENYGAIRDGGAEVVAIVVASQEAVDGMCQRAVVDYPVLSDANHEVSEAYGVFDLLDDGLAAPAVFIIDGDGQVVWSQIGQLTRMPVPAATILEYLP